MSPTMQRLAKWGERYNLTLNQVVLLRKTISLYSRQCVHYCNGDPYPSVKQKDDKNANAAAWDAASEITANTLLEIVAEYGFDGIDFGVGLYPALIKGDETCIMVP